MPLSCKPTLIALLLANFVSAAQAVELNIPAQPLDKALNALAHQSGERIIFSTSVTSQKVSTPLQGDYTTRQALEKLLAGSGLAVKETTDGGYTVVPVPSKPEGKAEPQALPEVSISTNRMAETAYGPVKGYVAKRSASGSKTDTPVVEVPQSISVVTRDEMNARNVQTLTDAVAYTPGVRVGAFGFDPRFDSFSIRGFDMTYTGMYRDGLRQLSSNFSLYKEEPYSAERIDILKGPSSVLYGQSEPSGLVNIVSKRPQFEAKHQADVQIGNYDRQQVRFDTTGALDNDNTLAYRLTGLYRDSDSPIKGAHDDRTYIAPALTWQPNDKTTLTILTHYQKDTTVGNSSYFNDADGHVDKHLLSGDPAFQNFTQEQYQIGYLFEHLLNEHWTLRQNVRTGRVDMNARYTQIDAIDTVNNVANRSTGQLVERLHTYAIDNQAQWQGNTGDLSHTVLFGLDWTRSINNGKMGFGAAPDLDLATLNYGAQPISAPVLDDPYQYRMNQVGVYAQDQIKWQQWILTVGGRHDWADTSQETTAESDDRSFKKFSGRVGLGYQLANGLTPYVSYATSFVPLLGRNATGGFFKPSTGRQIEAGIKYQPEDLNLMLTASVFQITQQNVVLNTGPASQMQAGEVRSRGFEVEAKTSLDSGVNLTAAYTFLMPKFTGRQDENYDNLQSGQPKNNLSLWADYTLPSGMLQGLGLGAGVRHIGGSYGDDANTYTNSKVTLFDMAAHYQLDPHWRFALNANNLADNRYSICTQGYCYVAQPRTVIGTLSYTW
ncbi:iron complex outermembrane recepter protein [Methylophilus rhizosphaerae]|uniref:Iron complex outermembrane recepter protein n=1 Tax=Methylophilus rhizosphaerae TaxID=492660 RepID=A0A1G9BMZ9_9PROT|nr:TonB-dependent siderophore receptor [Methylophilus rhizosphaerae]SDK40891.1 iron complex outermembrane recepter protein [Methylophilus rhizosphaerae]